MKELIDAIQEEKYEFIVGEGVMESAHNYALDKAIDLIETMLADKIIVPVEFLPALHMAGQYNEGDGVDPSYSNARLYVDKLLSTIRTGGG